MDHNEHPMSNDVRNQHPRLMASAVADELDRMHRLLNVPGTDSFLEDVRNEAAHQIQRWGEPRDRGKDPMDWFWLIGYLAGKAARAQVDGDLEKTKHHTISSAAALLNWHRSISGAGPAHARGGPDVERHLENKFGEGVSDRARHWRK